LICLVFVLYPMVCQASISGFNCRTIEGESLQVQALSQRCSYEDTSSSSFALHVVGSLLYPLGGPLLVFYILKIFRVDKLCNQKREKAILKALLLKARQLSSHGIGRSLSTHFVSACKQHDDEAVQAQIQTFLEQLYLDSYDVASQSLCKDRFAESLWRNSVDPSENQGYESKGDLAVWEIEFEVIFGKRLEGLSKIDFMSKALELIRLERIILGGSENPNAIDAAQIALLEAYEWEKVADPALRGEDDALAPIYRLGLLPSVITNARQNLKPSKRISALQKAENLMYRGLLIPPDIHWDMETEEEKLVLNRVGFLISDFKVDKWYWEICEMGRKLVLSSLITFLHHTKTTQIFLGILFTFSWLFVIVHKWPHKASVVNWVDIFTQITLLLTLYYGLLDVITSQVRGLPILDETKGHLVSLVIAAHWITLILLLGTWAWQNRRWLLKKPWDRLVQFIKLNNWWSASRAGSSDDSVEVHDEISQETISRPGSEDQDQVIATFDENAHRQGDLVTCSVSQQIVFDVQENDGNTDGTRKRSEEPSHLEGKTDRHESVLRDCASQDEDTPTGPPVETNAEGDTTDISLAKPLSSNTLQDKQRSWISSLTSC